MLGYLLVMGVTRFVVEIGTCSPDGKDAVASIGRPGLHFHDLRHTGNTLAAQTYVSTKDIMARMGQYSPVPR